MAAGKTPGFFVDPKNNTLNRPPTDVKMSVKHGGVALLPMFSSVLKYANDIDETKQKLIPQTTVTTNNIRSGNNCIFGICKEWPGILRKFTFEGRS